jgi:hypothetical protein
MTIATSISGDTLGMGALLTAVAFGFRHGIDWDHLAALTDITGTQERARRAIGLATLYALGHAAVVFTLGVSVIAFSEQLPQSIDSVMERAVGLTLVVLGLYVVVSLVRQGRAFRLRSRWMLVIAGVRGAARILARSRAKPSQIVVIEHDHVYDRLHHHVREHAGAHELASFSNPEPAEAAMFLLPSRHQMHQHRHRHALAMPDDPFPTYGIAGVLGIGALHGIGAETPTQLVIFVGAAGRTGGGAGVLLLACFIVGLLASNSVVAAAATFGFLQSSRRSAVRATVSTIAAVFSLMIGVLFLLGRGALLPAVSSG